jgi:hypothetical protein
LEADKLRLLNKLKKLFFLGRFHLVYDETKNKVHKSFIFLSIPSPDVFKFISKALPKIKQSRKYSQTISLSLGEEQKNSICCFLLQMPYENENAKGHTIFIAC